jgi:replicative DNA helicase
MVNKVETFEYGYSVQAKILTCIITDREFTTKILDTFETSYFDNKALQWLCEKTMKYFREFKNMPTLEVFQVEISKLDKDSIFKKEVISALRDVWTSIGSEDLPFLKKDIMQFCINQEYKKFLVEGVGLYESREFDKLEKAFKDVTKRVNMQTDLGLNYLQDVDYRYTEEANDERIETPWQVLNDIIGGGLPKKKLGIILAPTGVGKSWFLACLGAHALKQGKTVLHYTLELDDTYVAQRYDSILTGIPFGSLKYNIDKVKKEVSKYEERGKLFIKEFPPGTLSLQGLEAHVDQFIMNGIVPDVIILDYVELLKISFSDKISEVKVLGELYKDLRGLAGTKDVAIWSADQTNRDGSDEDVIGTNRISHSYPKLFAVDLLATASRRDKDKQNKTVRVHIAKSRLGPDGITFPGKMDTEIGYIELYAPKSEKGKKTSQEMISDERHLKNLANDKYHQYVKFNRQEPKDGMF